MQCYCRGYRPSRTVQPVELPPSLVRRAIAISIAAHALIVIAAWKGCPHVEIKPEIVDIEIAPEAPPVEALPEEVVRERGSLASKTEPKDDKLEDEKAVPEPGDYAVDAGVDAPPDTPPDTPPDSRPDAAILAKVPDAGVPDATEVAIVPDAIDAEVVAAVDAQPDAESVAVVDAAPEDAQVAAVDPWAEGGGSGEGSGSGSGVGVATGSGSGSGVGSGSAGSGSGASGMTNDPAVAGAATTAGTAANLLQYFPPGHEVTALIRFDRLRGTEWLKQTERLLQPMPDYQILFGTRDAKIGEKLDTLVISTPAPRDATATTLVGHTRLTRSGLRDFLSAATPIAWSTSKGGLLGKRTGKKHPGDKRLFLSPYDGWFLLSQPSDLGGLTAPAGGTLDSVVATAKLPPWLTAVKGIEKESGDKRGPSLVLTLALDGTPIETGPLEAAIGVKEVQQPERVSLAAELVQQGWLVRGNMRFKDAAAATAFISQVSTVQQRIVGASRVYDAILGKAAVSVIGRFQFARTGPKVSYTTSISIADMRAIMAVAAQQLDGYYKVSP